MTEDEKRLAVGARGGGKTEATIAAFKREFGLDSLHPYVVSDYYDGQPVVVLHPHDPASGPALEAYRNTLWRLYQRSEVPAYCAPTPENCLPCSTR